MKRGNPLIKLFRNCSSKKKEVGHKTFQTGKKQDSLKCAKSSNVWERWRLITEEKMWCGWRVLQRRERNVCSICSLLSLKEQQEFKVLQCSSCKGVFDRDIDAAKNTMIIVLKIGKEKDTQKSTNRRRSPLQIKMTRNKISNQ
ncbi:hypothetical protein K501DRAFT_266419 [Backusella circina FSU 941]|nr:hypothetical protein K501DRAFT_266419 [Backusella circina FSU 941]